MDVKSIMRPDVKRPGHGKRFYDDQVWGFSQILKCSWEEAMDGWVATAEYFVDGGMKVIITLIFPNAQEEAQSSI